MSSVTVNVFDGARQPFPPGLDILLTLRNGNQKTVFREFVGGPGVTVKDLPFFDNFGDNYAVIASASGHKQAGTHPVKITPRATAVVDLMLLGNDASFNFGMARLDRLKQTHPRFAELLAAGAESDAAAEDRYSDLMEQRPAALACVLNLVTAMSQINLPIGNPLDYFRELIWDDTMEPDRFFAYADRALVGQVRQAAEQGQFEPEPGSAIFHKGATSSFKQVQFGEANVQLTFHENDTRVIDGLECVKVEPDIDYFKDMAAHALLEVIAHGLTGSMSDPRQVYVLRWIASRRAGVPAFDPPYTII